MDKHKYTTLKSIYFDNLVAKQAEYFCNLYNQWGVATPCVRERSGEVGGVRRRSGEVGCGASPLTNGCPLTCWNLIARSPHVTRAFDCSALRRSVAAKWTHLSRFQFSASKLLCKYSDSFKVRGVDNTRLGRSKQPPASLKQRDDKSVVQPNHFCALCISERILEETGRSRGICGQSCQSIHASRNHLIEY